MGISGFAFENDAVVKVTNKKSECYSIGDGQLT
jgi:hypothetical protein